MKQLFTLTCLSIFTLWISFKNYDQHLSANNSGAPQGHSGAPGDNGRTCNACHGGPAPAPQDGWIVSDIPAGGYVPGQTYNITATASRSGINKFGFQVSPQNPSGAQIGSLRSTGTETAVQAAGKYITHTSFGTAGSGQLKTWNFEWVAPAAGAGPVTFYGSFLAANGNGGSSGDVTLTSALTVPERTATSTAVATAVPTVRLYPNPVRDQLGIYWDEKEIQPGSIEIFDLSGAEVKRISPVPGSGSVQLTAGIDFPASAAMYHVIVRMPDRVQVMKFTVQQ